jgi:excisionase family DNA binding protein
MDEPESVSANSAEATTQELHVLPALLSAREAADLLGVHERTVRRAIRDGRLQAFKRGRAFAISPEAIRAYRRGDRGGQREQTRPALALVSRHDAEQSDTAPGATPFSAGHTAWLPRPLSSLIGRQADIAAIAGLVAQGARLVTLHGPGGVGKTRLAIAAAETLRRKFADGPIFVPLAAVPEPDLVVPTIAKALGVLESLAKPLLETLVLALRDRHVLLVLDNVEHVLPAGVELARLLERCPRLVVLATSREPLRVRGEQIFPTVPLSLPPDEGKPLLVDAAMASDAVRLFVERARLLDRDFALTAANAGDLAAICRRVDGLPLAIELAASWVPILAPRALLGQLERRLPLLQGGSEDQPGRLRTMRDAIAWSYDLLSPDEAALFRRLAIFVGGFTLEAALRIGGNRRGDEPGSPYAPETLAALDTLRGLIDKSLLQVQHDGPGTRYAMLETVREFGLERLEASDEAALVAAAHARYLADFVERAEPHLLGPDEREWHDRLDTELGNVRAAVAWSLRHDVEVALRIGGALWGFWALRNQRSEGCAWLDQALRVGHSAPAPVRAKALATASALFLIQGDIPASTDYAEQAVELSSSPGDSAAEARALWIHGSIRYTVGPFEAATADLDAALVLFERVTSATDRSWAAYARSHRGALAMHLGERVQGVAFYEEAVALARDAGSKTVRLVIVGDFAGWLLDLGEVARARDRLDEALALAAETADLWMTGAVVIGLAAADALDGMAAIAARRLGAVESLREAAAIDMPPHFQRRIDAATSLARDAVGDDAFAAAWAFGYANAADIITRAITGARARIDAESHSARLLTPRERDVLRLLAAGHADKEIASELGISRATTSRHMAAIRAKLGAPSRSAAAAIAARDGLV